MKSLKNAVEEKQAHIDSIYKKTTQMSRMDLENALREPLIGIKQSLKKCLDELCLSIFNTHKIENNANDADDTRVIHYTSVDSLISMLQKPVKDGDASFFRLYDSVHLNDPDEGAFLGRNFSQKYDWIGKNDSRKKCAYIASFIMEEEEKNEKDMLDNLVFWRTYGREGQGCSLSLNIPYVCLRKVLYGRKDSKKTTRQIESILKNLNPLIKENDPRVSRYIQKELANTIWTSLEKIRYLYKSEAYDYEKEYRVVCVELDMKKHSKIFFEYKYHSNYSAHMRHYYEHKSLAISNKLINSTNKIMLGPCVPYQENVRRCIETLLKRAKIEGPIVSVSGIPYRRP